MNAVARASVTIAANAGAVWAALLSAEATRAYMFGTTVSSDWVKGSPITWKGEWKGRHYEDKGVVLDIEPERELRYSHFSPREGLADKPANYHQVRIELSAAGAQTLVTLVQDGNTTDEARERSTKNWVTMLASLKTYLEQGTPRPQQQARNSE